ncbi:TfoX N-terminal domain protein [Streptococcus sp. AS20]|nr:TfoX N-terminal domain protein [Streptococcus sp. AS20]
MASSKEYLDFILEQVSELDNISYRAMMGEFIIYYNGKIIGGIHDDRLLNSAIEEEEDIIRLSSSPKINFAKTGFELHEKGDICSFCGNNIADDTFDELEKFFSASKIKDFENSINQKN